MERAIELAKECFDEGEVPVGAVIVKDEKITGEGKNKVIFENDVSSHCLLYTSPSPRDATLSRMPSSA